MARLRVAAGYNTVLNPAFLSLGVSFVFARVTTGLLLILTVLTSMAPAAELLVEAESFKNRGGWQLDTQFIQQMGSPYLLAHGLGIPVADATTTVDLKQPGKYIVWVRTYDWVARWKTAGHPGRFALSINGKQLSDQLGTEGEKWQWQKAGEIELKAGPIELKLHDLMGSMGVVTPSI